MTSDPARTRSPGQRRAGPPPWWSLRQSAASRWPLGRIIGAGMLALGVVLIAAIVVGAVTLSNLSTAAPQVVDTIDPAAFHGSQLYVAMLNQETGVRGYLLSGQRPFLDPYTSGVAEQAAQVDRLRPLLAGLPAAQRDLSTALSQNHRLADDLRRARHRAGGRPPASRCRAATSASARPTSTACARRSARSSAIVARERSLAVARLRTAASGLDRSASPARWCCCWS